MGVVVVGKKVTKQDLVKAREDYGDFLKIVVDIETGAMTIGGEWHADGEQTLLRQGSQQKNLWGGGINLKTKKIESVALINIRPRLNNDSQEILDTRIREKFIKIAKQKFNL